MNEETKSAELVEVEERALQAPMPSGLSPMVQAIMSGQVSTEQMKEMLEIQKDFEQNEARKAYYQAVAAFKKSAPTVKKDKHVEFELNAGGVTSYNHTTLGYALTEINPVLSKHGLSLSWETKQAEGMITVTCYLSHEAGHRESTALSAGADSTGKKNPIQQIASTVTYLKRHTAFAILGLESVDDDDGAASGEPVERITEEQSKTIDAKLRENDLDRDKFLKWLRRVHKIDSIDQIAAAGFNDVMRTIDQTIKAKQHD